MFGNKILGFTQIFRAEDFLFLDILKMSLSKTIWQLFFVYYSKPKCGMSAYLRIGFSQTTSLGKRCPWAFGVQNGLIVLVSLFGALGFRLSAPRSV
jgi:hypothetical protein